MKPVKCGRCCFDALLVQRAIRVFPNESEPLDLPQGSELDKNGTDLRRVVRAIA